MGKKLLKIIEPILLLLVIVVLVLCAVFNVKNSGLLTALVALSSFIPFVARFEMQKPKPSEIMPIAVLSAFAIVGRIAMAPIPSFQPVSAIIIFTGIFFGRQSGYLTGAFTALISNMILGQGAWTPWQMYTWGMMGFFAGFLAEKGLFGGIGKGNLKAYSSDKEKKTFMAKVVGFLPQLSVLIYAVISTALFSLVLDTWYIIAFINNVTAKTIVVVYTTGLLSSIPNVLSTVIILVIILKPWGKKIERIKIKYGVAPTKIV